MITIEDAQRNADTITNAAAKSSATVCHVNNVILTNKRDGFHLIIIIVLCPYSPGIANPPACWQQQIEGGQRETLYAHILRIRIPETAMDDETKLKQIGEALSDIWYESRYFAALRTDRRYIIPHINNEQIDARWA